MALDKTRIVEDLSNATVIEIADLVKELEGKYVRLEVREKDYLLAPADSREVDERNRQRVKRGDLVTERGVGLPVGRRGAQQAGLRDP